MSRTFLCTSKKKFQPKSIYIYIYTSSPVAISVEHLVVAAYPIIYFMGYDKEKNTVKKRTEIVHLTLMN